MHVIKFNSKHRQQHFDFFKKMNHPHFNVTVPVVITPLLPFLKSRQLPFTPAIVYLLARAANEQAEFRWRIRGEEVVEHQLVHPSFSVNTDVADVFSFCTVPFQRKAKTFIENAKKQMAAMRQNPSFSDEPGRDDYLFMSAFPWASFTSIQHAMSYHPCDSVPRIVWGKYYEENGQIKMPVNVQAHHGLVDGRHLGIYFQLVENMMSELSTIF
ncbi:MAG: chloramphenicol acetyltransferase [Saprospiraceae bacterium]|nr:MAG: chloramphenicol acetyltransferase [Saprospiraceae bacterium]